MNITSPLYPATVHFTTRRFNYKTKIPWIYNPLGNRSREILVYGLLPFPILTALGFKIYML